MSLQLLKRDSAQLEEVLLSGVRATVLSEWQAYVWLTAQAGQTM
jgi:hypothetical protein